MRNLITRKGVSQLLFLSFLVMGVTGVLSFGVSFSKTISGLHVFFGFVFLIMAVIHFGLNIRPLQHYFFSGEGKLNLVAKITVWLTLIIVGFNHLPPFSQLISLSNELKTGQSIFREDTDKLLLYDYRQKTKEGSLQLEIKKGKHFWYPQLAIWLEDTSGNYLKTIFVTNSTAKGLFYASRTKDNFRLYDGKSFDEGLITRRVDALPHWSHQRNVRYPDGFYVPTTDQPLPDGISGATPRGGMVLLGDLPESENFIIKLEVNVAFDENKFFSAFDYPDDSLYHSGAGLMGQPSLIYQAVINRNGNSRYYLMELLGHGHQSGQSGEIYTNVEVITTAKQILDRIVVGFQEKS